MAPVWLRYASGMETTLHVAVLDSSFLMAGIASALRAQAGMRVFVTASVETLARQLAEGGVTLLLFDVAAVAPITIRTLVRENAALTCIGIDLGACNALALSSATWPLGSLTDLVRLIDWMDSTNAALDKTTAPLGLQRIE